MSVCLVLKKDLTPILTIYDKDKNSLSKIGNIKISPFGLLKQAATSSCLCSIYKQLLLNIYPINFCLGMLVHI